MNQHFYYKDVLLLVIKYFPSFLNLTDLLAKKYFLLLANNTEVEQKYFDFFVLRNKITFSIKQYKSHKYFIERIPFCYLSWCTWFLLPVNLINET